MGATIKTIDFPLKKYLQNPVYNFIGLVIIFFLLMIFIPANNVVMHTYNMSPHEYRILLFITEIPVVIIWFAAFYGYYRLREYTASIEKTKEEIVFKKLTLGILWLAWGFVLPTILALIFSMFISTSNDITPAMLIFENYISLLFPLVGFTIIADGAHRLITYEKLKSARISIRLLLLTFVACATLYCYFTFRNLNLNQLTSTGNPYYLPVWLIIFTITIPYLYTWLIGLLAAYEYSIFAKQVKGVIYRRAIQLVTVGVVLIIVDSIAVQYIHSIIPRTGHISLNSILVATYLLYFVIVLGFILITIGANKLKKIEDI